MNKSLKILDYIEAFVENQGNIEKLNASTIPNESFDVISSAKEKNDGDTIKNYISPGKLWADNEAIIEL